MLECNYLVLLQVQFDKRNHRKIIEIMNISNHFFEMMDMQNLFKNEEGL